MWRKCFLGLAFLAAACTPPAASTTQADAADTAADLMQTVDIASHSGQSFAAFTSAPGMEQFALEKLDLAPDERARVQQDFTLAQPSRLIAGGGAQALVFIGCARDGCDAGQAVLAFGNHGETFVGVSDRAGAAEFIPDDRMEALLRLNSPTRRWDDPGRTQPPSSTPAP